MYKSQNRTVRIPFINSGNRAAPIRPHQRCTLKILKILNSENPRFPEIAGFHCWKTDQMVKTRLTYNKIEQLPFLKIIR